MPDGQLPFDASANQKKKTAELRVEPARTMEDMMKVTAIRAAVYMSDQHCPYDEEFDGNDFCATHLIGYVGREPVACARVRYFGGFAKLERVAVRSDYRKTKIAFALIKYAREHCLRKGFTKIMGHARDELIPLWRMFGFKIPENGRTLVFSDYSYTEMVWEKDLPQNAITLTSDPYQVIRPEGDWDRPGILEESAVRDLSDYPEGFAIAAE